MSRVPTNRCAQALLVGGLWLTSFCGAQSPLPTPQTPPENPLSPAKILLGKILFWDEQLSSDDSMACGTCHVPEFGGGEPRTTGTIHPGPDGLYATADDIHGSPGVVRQLPGGDFAPEPTFGLGVQVTRRQSPSNIGAAFHVELFWDGRATSQFVDPENNQVAGSYAAALENQALAPILSPVEMGHDGRTWQDVRQKLTAARPLALARNLTPDITAALSLHPSYPALFTATFGDPAITARRIVYALASYQRTLIADDTPWDRFMTGQTTALTPNQQAGWGLFQGNAQCVACHHAPLFTDDLFHNLGLRPKSEDTGLGGVIQVPSEEGSFKTPTLRNNGLRMRLFHNGQSAGLLDPNQVTDPASVMNIYLNGGGVDRGNLDPFLSVLTQNGVTVADMQQVLDFVANGLTDARAAQGLPPFDHPQLRSMAVAAPLVFGQSQPGASEPRLIDSVPPWPGNSDYKLGMAAGDGVTLSVLAYGLQSVVPTIVSGVPFHIAPLDFQTFLLQGPSGAPGHATWHLPVPDDHNLVNLPLYFQLFALDTVAPNGFSASRGWELMVR